MRQVAGATRLHIERNKSKNPNLQPNAQFRLYRKPPHFKHVRGPNAVAGYGFRWKIHPFSTEFIEGTGFLT
jgi:hypothetical protein